MILNCMQVVAKRTQTRCVFGKSGLLPQTFLKNTIVGSAVRREKNFVAQKAVDFVSKSRYLMVAPFVSLPAF